MSDRRSWLAGVLVAAILLVVAGLIVAQSRDEPGSAAQPSEGPEEPSAESAGSEPVLELTWDEAGGAALPVSAMHGPRSLRDGLASGWSQSEKGAALAAAHLLVRSGPTVGPEVFEPTISGQVTGPNTAALKLAVNEQHSKLEHTADAAQKSQGVAQMVGYRVSVYDPAAGSAVIELVLDSAQLAESQRYLQVTVSLQWLNDDWWLVAPPKGDWAVVSTPLGALPDGLQRYEDLA